MVGSRQNLDRDLDDGHGRMAPCGTGGGILEARRRLLRSGTALAGGILAFVVASPQGARAACIDVTGSGPFIVTCTTGTATTAVGTNSTSPATNNASRTQSFAGNIEAAISANATIQGLGLEVRSTSPGSTIAVDNQGIVTSTAGALGALQITGVGGAITYNGSGRAVATGGDQDGLTITNTGTGIVTIGGTGPIAGAYTGAGTGNGISIVTAGGSQTASIGAAGITGANGLSMSSTTGNLTLDANGAAVTTTAASGRGILLATGDGSIAATLASGTTLSNASGASNTTVGLDASTGAGSITLSSSAGIGAPGATFATGINAVSTGGAISVTQNAALSADMTGINATTAGAGNVAVTTGAGGTIATLGAGDAGVNAAATSGAVTINLGAAVDAAGHGLIASGTTGPVSVTTGAVSAGQLGIRAQTDGGGAVTVTTNGAVTGGNGFFGITAIQASGTDNVTVTTRDTVTAGGGIFAQSSVGSVTVDTSNGGLVLATHAGGDGVQASSAGAISVNTGAVTAGRHGIRAESSGGGVTVTTHGAVTGTRGVGIVAEQTAGNGNVSVTTGAAVSGVEGIFAGARGTGTVTLDTRLGAVTGTGGDGVFAFAAGAVSVTTGAVSGTLRGIGAFGGGAVTVTTHGAVEGRDYAGIDAQQHGGAGNVVVTTGGTVAGEFGIVAYAAGAGALTVDTSNGGAVTGTDATGVAVTGAAGPVSVTTGAVSGASYGINAGTESGGAVTVTTNGAVTGGNGFFGLAYFGIAADQTGGNGNVAVTTRDTVTAGAGIFARAEGTGSVTVNTGNGRAVTGTIGSGIITATVDGNTTVDVNTTGSVITGTGPGNAGIASFIAGTGSLAINLAQGTTANNATGLGLSITQTGAGTGTYAVNNAGTITGAGSATDPVIGVATTSGTTSINNLAGGVIRSVGDLATDLAVASTGGPIDISNTGTLTGRVTLAGNQATLTNNNAGVWTVSGASAFSEGNDTLTNAAGGTIDIVVGGGTSGFDFGAGPADGLTNNGLIVSLGAVSFTNIETIANGGAGGGSGVFNVGRIGVVGDGTSFSSASAQTATNTGIFNVRSLQAQAGPYTGSLNFTGAAGSSFTNAQGLINMQADGNATTNATTFNIDGTGLTGTSDLDYGYRITGAAYNFVGGTGSRLAIDAFLGAAGATSDRLVVGGSVSGVTEVAINDTNAGAGAYNPTGITVAAVQGAGANNFVVSPANTGYAAYGPLGAVAKGLYLYPLLYVPGSPNTYKLVGVPGPFLFNMPVAHTAAQTIWSETAFAWEDRQDQLRGDQRRLVMASHAEGNGADLPVAAAPPAPRETGIWLKGIGSWTTRNVSAAQLAPFAGVLPAFDSSYTQSIGGVVVGFDRGRSEIFGPADSFTIGVMGGYVASQVSFDQSLVAPFNTAQLRFSGGSVGVSASYMNGGFYIDALGKADFLTLSVNGIPAGAGIGSADLNARTWGVLANAGYRFDLGRTFVEPVATLLYARSRIDDMALPAAATTVNFGTGDTLNGAIGARFGGVVLEDHRQVLTASVSAKAWGHLAGGNAVNVINLGPTFVISDTFTRPFAETALQLDWHDRASGWEAFLKSGVKFNQEFVTATAKGGVRLQW
jgi:hypothetical protein